MAGTNRSREAATGGPAVLLVRPQLGENIGMVARAMLNCGLDDLRLVAPRDGWPNPAAEAAASGALAVIERARVFATLEEAVADLRWLYATTARERGLVKAVTTPRQAAQELRRHFAAGEPAGLLFGPERTGLENDEVALADAVVEVPLNPAFSSLNLAQAVLILGYEWFQAGVDVPLRELRMGPGKPAEKAELLAFFERLEAILEEMGFFYPPEKRASMVRNLRSFFARGSPTAQEVRTLQGVVSALLGAKERRAGRRARG